MANDNSATSVLSVNACAPIIHHINRSIPLKSRLCHWIVEYPRILTGKKLHLVLLKIQFTVLTVSLKKKAEQFLILTRISIDPRLRGSKNYKSATGRILFFGTDQPINIHHISSKKSLTLNIFSLFLLSKRRCSKSLCLFFKLTEFSIDSTEIFNSLRLLIAHLSVRNV